MNSEEVVEYLSRLSVYVYIIDLRNKGIEYIPDLTRFTSLLGFYCSGNRLTSLPALPDSVSTISCDDNMITCLPDRLPRELRKLSCNKNRISRLPNVLPHQLELLNCSDNQLTTLPKNLPNKLRALNCKNNLITMLPQLPERVYIFSIINNPVAEIIVNTKDTSIECINKKISIMIRFNRIVHGEIIRKTIWVKYLEPKIRQKYSPENLIKKMLEYGIVEDGHVNLEHETFSQILDKWR
jgi:Leucine-rich repeat (LRR) protein